MNTNNISLEKTSLGIEFGSTRIKLVLIDAEFQSIVTGEFSWENQLKNDLWTYDLDDAWNGLQEAYKQLKAAFEKKYQIPLTTVGSIGISAMMHGYLPFDGEGKLLAPFRTWRNTNTSEAAKELSLLFHFNIPLRWGIAHFYQAILNGETHVKSVSFLTTLAGYIHWKLTGEKVLGIGDASGMFPIDSKTNQYNQKMIEFFNHLLKEKGLNQQIKYLLPRVLCAGEAAGTLTVEGARFIDPEGDLQAGIPLCPPEGDAGTGMVATNSIREKTGNVSAGTSVFSMIVLEEELKNYYEEIDVVTTPAGKSVAMIHCNNFTSDINEWVDLLLEFSGLFGKDISRQEAFGTLFKHALQADANTGGLMNFGYYSGEPITKTDTGRPFFARMPDSHFTLANFMKTLIYSAIATLEIGMRILTEKEHVSVEMINGHGGFFKTKGVGQQIFSDALNIPIATSASAGEGGPWGMAVLASFMWQAKGQTLDQFLNQRVFKDIMLEILQPAADGTSSYKSFVSRFEKAVELERLAGKVMTHH